MGIICSYCGVCVCVCVTGHSRFKMHVSIPSATWWIQDDGFMLTPHCWWRSCVTWFWGTCRSLSLSGTGRTPCADSGGMKGGAPTQDSPANPWDCGLARDHSPHRSWRGLERKLGLHLLYIQFRCWWHDKPKHTQWSPSCFSVSSFLERKLKEERCDRCCSMNPCSCDSVVPSESCLSEQIEPRQP